MFSARVEIPYFFALYLKLAELIKNRNKRDNITANGLNYHTRPPTALYYIRKGGGIY